MKLRNIGLAVLASAFALTSCDSLGDVAPTGPTITVSPMDTTLWKGDTLNYSYSITSDAVITSLTATPDDSSFATQEITTFNGSYAADGTIQYVIGDDVAVGDMIHISFKAVDADGMAYADSVKAMITIDLDGTLMTYENTGAILNNLMGPYRGAWDLVANDSLSSSADDANKDMINTTLNDSLFVGDYGFSKGWNTSNGTMFVKANDFDYEHATVEAATAAYAAGTATADVQGVNTGDIYIAKLRGGDDYAVIKITSIVLTSDDNKDRIVFTYKKA